MTRLLMLVEGQSEEIFVKQTLTPHLADHGVFVQPIVLWTKRLGAGGGYRGGVSNWNQIKRSLLPLTLDTDAWITTLLDFYGLQADTITAVDIAAIVRQWQEAVVGLDKMVYEDAKKEYSLTSMTGFGADGSSEEKMRDFEEVRGVFESNPFVTTVLEHIKVKTELGNELIERVKNLL